MKGVRKPAGKLFLYSNADQLLLKEKVFLLYDDDRRQYKQNNSLNYFAVRVGGKYLVEIDSANVENDCDQILRLVL